MQPALSRRNFIQLTTLLPVDYSFRFISMNLPRLRSNLHHQRFIHRTRLFTCGATATS